MMKVDIQSFAALEVPKYHKLGTREHKFQFFCFQEPHTEIRQMTAVPASGFIFLLHKCI